MSRGETARKNYESARSELLQRLLLRDQVLLVFIAATGTILGAALGEFADFKIIITIPYLAVGMAVLLAQHNSAIGALVTFCSNEIQPFLKSLTPPEDAPQWDNSKSAQAFANESLWKRTIGHYFILLFPSVAALAATPPRPIRLDAINVLWGGGIIATVVAAAFLWLTHIRRAQSFRAVTWTAYDNIKKKRN